MERALRLVEQTVQAPIAISRAGRRRDRCIQLQLFAVNWMTEPAADQIVLDMFAVVYRVRAHVGPDISSRRLPGANVEELLFRRSRGLKHERRHLRNHPGLRGPAIDHHLAVVVCLRRFAHLAHHGADLLHEGDNNLLLHPVSVLDEIFQLVAAILLRDVLAMRLRVRFFAIFAVAKVSLVIHPLVCAVVIHQVDRIVSDNLAHTRFCLFAYRTVQAALVVLAPSKVRGSHGPSIRKASRPVEIIWIASCYVHEGMVERVIDNQLESCLLAEIGSLPQQIARSKFLMTRQLCLRRKVGYVGKARKAKSIAPELARNLDSFLRVVVQRWVEWRTVSLGNHQTNGANPFRRRWKNAFRQPDSHPRLQSSQRCPRCDRSSALQQLSSTQFNHWHFLDPLSVVRSNTSYVAATDMALVPALNSSSMQQVTGIP